MADKDNTIHVRPLKGNEDLKAKLQEYADSKGLSLNKLTEKILSEFIKSPRELSFGKN